MQDKVVIVTGASSGIGKALVYALARQKAKVMMAARNTEKMKLIADDLLSMGYDVRFIQTDVSKREDCINLIQEGVKAFGKIDVLINNAGISMRALFVNTELEVLQKLMNVNFWGTVYCTKAALPYLLQSSGTVVGVTSIAGYIGLPGRVGYSSSKYALNGFLEVLRTENLKTGLHVLTAAPGFTTSNIRNVALGADGSAQGESPRDENKMMSAEKVAEKIIRAVKRKQTRLIFTTEGKIIYWFNTIFPRIIGRITYRQMAKEPDSPFN